ncbi:hypothetical protein VOLCADRAFT_99824 [Volvox carteri f. nagariensis]|uniref:Uncharacterized protein n=1 Tax=Volvox carteri f. nagariensis TaxID=3068 RepID=D8UIR6_VOLCA|nr:uncharacterized protein VOLCADRAFT_99824 [Volvox carteri f. nagariensis]EFJ40385.1 hypothetical protein VOLCADRAFT_99824 [Volvox carteri f. nagariensis]|eukprot:XP_002958536.1 hypothetical protein VOLCADRAFT_99824 [Volvox carteri f. nagariensis]
MTDSGAGPSKQTTKKDTYTYGKSELDAAAYSTPRAASAPPGAGVPSSWSMPTPASQQRLAQGSLDQRVAADICLWRDSHEPLPVRQGAQRADDGGGHVPANCMRYEQTDQVPIEVRPTLAGQGARLRHPCDLCAEVYKVSPPRLLCQFLRTLPWATVPIPAAASKQVVQRYQPPGTTTAAAGDPAPPLLPAALPPDIRDKMYSAVPEATVEELYNCYGGVARYVLQCPFENPSWGLPRLLQPLTRILATCNVQQVRAAMDAIDMGPEASHRLVHIVPYDNFKEKRLTFASDWVAEEFTKRAWIDEQDQVKSLMEYSAKAVKGILFEKVMHGVLAMGGKFDVVPLHPETLERGEEEELDIQACTESLRFTDDEASDMMSSIKNMYLRPMSGNFPVIDALKVPEMHLFQMTISRSKVLNADELENVLKRLGIPAPGQEGCQPSLYFVVHSGVYNKFKEMDKEAAEVLYMPFWEHKELLDCHRCWV